MAPPNSDLQEYEVQFFGFSPKGFVDTVYNIIIDKWKGTVNSRIMPGLPLPEVDDQKRADIRKGLITSICSTEKLNGLLEKLERYLTTYIFRIPEFVTLPEDVPNLKVPENGDAEKQMERRIQSLSNNILELRLASQMLDGEIENTEKTLKLIDALEEKDSNRNGLEIMEH